MSGKSITTVTWIGWIIAAVTFTVGIGLSARAEAIEKALPALEVKVEKNQAAVSMNDKNIAVMTQKFDSQYSSLQQTLTEIKASIARLEGVPQ